ncbi:isochorismatase family protein [uncultured Friedmanniella sp.]|uniref:isochorismatase family protein n=1 Tax=uncultured Friedmanniella sp. TaxID=335381 RepID=UPI0035C9EC46
MTTLEGRGSRALLVVDLQVGVVDGAHQREEVIATVVDLVARARASSVPVVWVQHHDDELVQGSDAWQWVGGLGPADGEPLVEKSYGDAFADTDLERVLAERGVSEIVLVGAASEQCVRCTMHSAVVGGYDVSLVADAHTTTDLTAYGLPTPAVVVGFLNAIAQFGMQWPGRSARSVPAADVGF